MWKKDRDTVFLTTGLLTMVLLFCIFSQALLRTPCRMLEEWLRQGMGLLF